MFNYELICKLFPLFYNFSMQGVKELNQSDFAYDLYQSFMNQRPSLLEANPTCSSEMIVEDKNTDQPLVKGKGRPKGEKNSKDKERKVKTMLPDENRRRGHWSVEENKKYHWFLEIYSRHFICKQMRRLDKIFKTMAVFIGSREAQQCRSHHQKMEKKYHSFASILLYLRKYHYGTEDSSMLEQDMLRNQVKEQAKLISHKELQGLELIKQSPTQPCLQEEAKVQNEMNEPMHQFQFQQNLLDLLGEDYEHRFDFDNILL